VACLACDLVELPAHLSLLRSGCVLRWNQL
jgi:hypothetical protein